MLHYLELPGWVPDSVLDQLIKGFSGQARTELAKMVRASTRAAPATLHKRSVSQESASAVSTTSEGSHEVDSTQDSSGLVESIPLFQK